MHIYSIHDAEFAAYGRVWDDVPVELTSPVVRALEEQTPLPEGSAYTPSEPALESLPCAETLKMLMYGASPVQIGWCNGHNRVLNCLEYHRSSEFNLGARDFILLLARRDQIVDGRLDTSLVKAFRAPAGTLVEVFATTLHYTPCMVDDDGFRVMVALPRGTNTPKPDFDLPQVGDAPMLSKTDKWVLCHPDSPKAAQGGYVGLVGENITIPHQA